MAEVLMTQGGTPPAMVARIFQSNNKAADLNDATVTFTMRGLGRQGAVIIDHAPVDILEPSSAGRVQFDWPSGCSDVVGDYRGKFEVVYGNSISFEAPTKASIYIKVYDDIDNE